MKREDKDGRKTRGREGDECRKRRREASETVVNAGRTTRHGRAPGRSCIRNQENEKGGAHSLLYETY